MSRPSSLPDTTGARCIARTATDSTTQRPTTGPPHPNSATKRDISRTATLPYRRLKRKATTDATIDRTSRENTGVGSRQPAPWFGLGPVMACPPSKFAR
eukprot:11209134-Lingulodinium_polyedra.AAC.1